MRRPKISVALLMLFVALSGGSVLADTIHDPIIDLEGGGGSNDLFKGQVVTTTINGIVGQNSCGFFDDSSTLTCGTVNSFIRPGEDGSGVFRNLTGEVITNFHVSIATFTGLNGNGDPAGIVQGTFSAFPTNEAGINALFPGPIIPDADGNGATFTGGSIPLFSTVLRAKRPRDPRQVWC